MKMRITAALLAAAMMFSLSACGSTGKQTDSGTKSGTESVKAVSKLPEITKGGTTVDVGEFSLSIPEGWIGVTEEDVFAEEKSTVTDAYSLVKGGKTKMDVALLPTLYVNYFDNKTAQEKFETSGGLFKGTTEVEVKVGGKSYKGYFGESNIAQEGDEPDYFKREVLFIPASETSCFRIYLETYSPTEGKHEANLADSDVTSIIESLKENAK